MSLLAEARAKTLTNNLFQEVLTELSEGGSVSKPAKNWWKKNKVELIGLSIAEAISLFNAAQKKKNLLTKYDELVSSMTWSEKIKFMRLGIKQMKKTNSRRLKTASLINSLLEATPKIISIILMVI